MPVNLTPTNGNYPTQTAPAAGESRTAGSVQTPFQNAADRTQYVKDRIDYIDPSGGGARRLRYAATFTALRAITDLTDDAVIIVDGQGLYIYDAGSGVAELEPFVIKPTSVGLGNGRWISSIYLSLDVANGIPKLDTNGRVPTARLAASNGGSKILGSNVANGIVDIYAASAAGPFTTNAQAYSDVGSIAATFTLAVGDRVLLTGQAYVYQADQTPAIHYTRLAVVLPDTSTALVAQSEIPTKTTSLNENIGLPIGACFTASVAGSHTFKLQQKSEAASGGATVGVANLNLCAQVLRP